LNDKIREPRRLWEREKGGAALKDLKTEARAHPIQDSWQMQDE
jgi:hypothetical protein